MSHCQSAGVTEPQEPLARGLSCCVWCGNYLGRDCPDDHFGSDVCESKWMAWRNRVVPLDPPPSSPPPAPAPVPSGFAGAWAALWPLAG